MSYCTALQGDHTDDDHDGDVLCFAAAFCQDCDAVEVNGFLHFYGRLFLTLIIVETVSLQIRIVSISASIYM